MWANGSIAVVAASQLVAAETSADCEAKKGPAAERVSSTAGIAADGSATLLRRRRVEGPRLRSPG